MNRVKVLDEAFPAWVGISAGVRLSRVNKVILSSDSFNPKFILAIEDIYNFFTVKRRLYESEVFDIQPSMIFWPYDSLSQLMRCKPLLFLSLDQMNLRNRLLIFSRWMQETPLVIKLWIGIEDNTLLARTTLLAWEISLPCQA